MIIMRMGRGVLERIVLWSAVVWALAACSNQSGVGVPGEPLEVATVRQTLVDACALLDQPLARRRMSGSFESYLLRKCGRIGAPSTRAARSLPKPPSGAPAAGAKAAVS